MGPAKGIEHVQGRRARAFLHGQVEAPYAANAPVIEIEMTTGRMHESRKSELDWKQEPRYGIQENPFSGCSYKAEKDVTPQQGSLRRGQSLVGGAQSEHRVLVLDRSLHTFVRTGGLSISPGHRIRASWKD